MGSGQTCFADMTIAPCETSQSGNNDQSNQDVEISNRCGATWEDANNNCGNVQCISQDTECPSGQTCFADMTIAPCETSQSANNDQSNQDVEISNRCGTTWED